MESTSIKIHYSGSRCQYGTAFYPYFVTVFMCFPTFRYSDRDFGEVAKNLCYFISLTGFKQSILEITIKSNNVTRKRRKLSNFYKKKKKLKILIKIQLIHFYRINGKLNESARNDTVGVLTDLM